MKKVIVHLIFLLFVASPIVCIAQDKKSAKATADNTFTRVDQMPEYPGGLDKLYDHINAEMHYPQDAVDSGKEGRVVVKFTVLEDGSIDHIKIVRSLWPSMDAEAIRIVKSFPKWIPGKNKGKPVAVFFTLPFSFQLK